MTMIAMILRTRLYTQSSKAGSVRRRRPKTTFRTTTPINSSRSRLDSPLFQSQSRAKTPTVSTLASLESAPTRLSLAPLTLRFAQPRSSLQFRSPFSHLTSLSFGACTFLPRLFCTPRSPARTGSFPGLGRINSRTCLSGRSSPVNRLNRWFS